MSHNFLRYSAMMISGFLFMTFAAFSQGSPDILWSVAGHSNSVESISFSEDGQEVISGGGTDVRIWQAATGSLLQTIAGYPTELQSVSISPDESYLAAGYIVGTFPPGGVMDIRALPQGNIVFNFAGCFVKFSPNGELIASGGGGTNRYADVHRLSNGAQIGHFFNGPAYIRDIAFSPDNQILAAAVTDNTIKLWDIGKGVVVRTLTGHTDDVHTIDFSPDGQLLASGAGGFDNPGESTIKLWQVSDGSLIRTLEGHDDWVYDVSFSPDGLNLISCGRDSIFPSVDPKIKIWRVSDGALLKYYDQDLNQAAISINYSPDGQTYCYGRSDGTVTVALNPFLTGLPGNSTNLPETVQLYQNYPNPFNPATTIKFTLPESQKIILKIYNAAGQEVRTLVNEFKVAGKYELSWDGTNKNNFPVASGVYLYRIETSNYGETRKMILIR
jgi:WD40 repeat protein